MSPRVAFAAEQIGLRLRPLNRALRAAVARQAHEAAKLERPDLTPYCITDELACALLDRVEAIGSPDGFEPVNALDRERRQEAELRERAASAGVIAPLDELVDHAGLSADEADCLLICLAPEVDRGYERIFAYILDDLNRRMPCAELLCATLGGSSAENVLIRRHLASSGRLRRFGLIEPWGTAPTQLRQEFRAAPGLVEFLMGAPGDLSLLAHDPGAVPHSSCEGLPANVDRARVAQLGRALRGRAVELVGVWGAEWAGASEVVRALAAEADMELRCAAGMAYDDVAAAIAVAAAMRALLWIPVEATSDAPRLDAVGELLSRSQTPVCLSGAVPWRPTAALSTRPYAEIMLEPPAFRHRATLWSALIPEAEPSLAEDLAGCYRMSRKEILAVGALARTTALFSANGSTPKVSGDLFRQAAMAVADRRTAGFAHAVVPRRTPDDLVLPEEQQRQVLEISAAYRAWPQICDNWGFARYSSRGVKALFCGEPGTGKSLAAEVIAGTLGLTLLKIDLAQVVSKWVGETEKNLESAFQQAENCHAVLFFDEADALFGKRGDVKQGMDRYANLEVGFLLQRLEQSDSLVILASNLKENIDPAFTRRFHYIVQFPRPGLEERRRIWRVSFPPEAPLACDVDLDALAQLDMTGAAIAGAARSAALLAADAGRLLITAADVVGGVSRQYQRDSRLLRLEDLGMYGDLAAKEARWLT
jgi:AAA+ superfamily predicted ATPase